MERRSLLLTGAAGLVGALTMLAGDLLLYLHTGPMPAVAPEIDRLLSVRQAIVLATREQLIVSSVLGPVAAIFYVVGAWHLYARLNTASTRWATVAAVLFAATTIVSGAYHALWGTLGFAVQYANQQPPGPTAVLLLLPMMSGMSAVVQTSTLLGLPLALLMLAMVITANRRIHD